MPEPAPDREAGAHADLTDDDVREIRADFASGKWERKDLAYIHGVSKNMISRIVRGLDYADVEPQPNGQD